jgi:hypothetical protein
MHKLPSLRRVRMNKLPLCMSTHRKLCKLAKSAHAQNVQKDAELAQSEQKTERPVVRVPPHVFDYTVCG